MAWTKHPRNITDYQAQKGCVVDAMSLDDAMQDVIDWINALPPSSVETRWLSHTAVAGWSPAWQYQSWNGSVFGSATLTPRQYPFLAHLNSLSNATYSPTTSPPERFMNRQRVKGTQVPGLDSNRESVDNYQLVWTVPLRFPSPTVLRSIDLTLATDDSHNDKTGGYNNTFLYDDAGARELPRGYQDDDPMENLSIVVHVDHPLASERRELNDVEVAIHNVSTGAGAAATKRRRSVSAIQIPSLASGTWTDMVPARVDSGSLEGIHISEEVNVPLRPGARVRISIVVPIDTVTGATTFPGWNTVYPQLTQQWNLSYTWMEALT